jgi:hypothetical protein
MGHDGSAGRRVGPGVAVKFVGAVADLTRTLQQCHELALARILQTFTARWGRECGGRGRAEHGRVDRRRAGRASRVAEG